MGRCLSNAGDGGRAAAAMITSIYTTHLGEIALSWSRNSLGLFLVTDLLLSPTPAKGEDDEITDHFRLYLRPFYPWRRKGSKRRQFTTTAGRRRVVELTWDMSVATFDRGPGPAAGYFVSIAVDGEVALVAGNTTADRYKNGERRSEQISQMERVRFGEMGGGLFYATKARFEEKEMAISISIDLQEEEMVVEIDGERVFEVERLRWNFRGSDGMVMRSGVRVRVSWDLHDWFFWRKGGWGRSPASIGRAGEAVFVLMFERCEEGEGEVRKGIAGGEELSEEVDGGCVKREELNDSGSGCWSTSVSSAASAEEYGCKEAELRSAGDGVFTLLVSGRKC